MCNAVFKFMKTLDYNNVLIEFKGFAGVLTFDNIYVCLNK